MDKGKGELWAAVDALLDPPSNPRERRLENVLEREGEYAGDDDLVQSVAMEIAQAIERHRKDWPIDTSPTRAEDVVSDVAYWRLVQDLNSIQQAQEQPSTPPYQWQPVTSSWTSWPLSDDVANQARVTLEFDHRFSQRSLVAQIRAMWPVFVKCGYVRQTRPLLPKAIALIRLICIELPPGKTWADRMKAWNKKHGRREGRYSDIYPFQRDFRRAERQLSGEPYGLEYFYNVAANLSPRELDELCDRGDKNALGYRDRRRTRESHRKDHSKRVRECKEEGTSEQLR